MIGKELFISSIETLQNGLKPGSEELWFLCFKLLEALLDDDSELLSWWVFDCDYGKNDPTLTLKVGKDEERVVVLDSPEKLYYLFTSSL